MDGFEIEVEGLRELEAAALRLGAKVGAAALRRGLVRASDPTLARMRALVPVGETGGLKAAIVRRSRIGGGRGARAAAAVVRIGPTKRISGRSVNNQAIAVEFGTRHQSAQPFMRPALAGTARRVVSTFGRFAWREISTVKATGAGAPRA